MTANERLTNGTAARDLLAAAAVGIIAVDLAGTIVSANAAAARLLARWEDELVGTRAEDLSTGDGDARIAFARAVASGQLLHVDDDMFRRGDGAVLPVWWATTPLRDVESGAGEGTVLVFGDTSAQRARDIASAAEHARRQADLASARRDAADLQWVADVTQALSSTLDDREVLHRLARLCAGRIADIVVVDLIDDDGVIERVAHAASPDVPLDLDAIMSLPDVAAPFEPYSATHRSTVASALVRLTAEDLLDADRLSPQTRALLAQVGATDVIAAPLLARNHVVGLVGLIATGSRHFDLVDEIVARDLAQRAALAVDNARLFRAQADISTRLQRALLPVLPAPVSVDVAVRYLPAAAHYDVGGDWYDLFRCPDDSETCVLVVGDVAGHDIAAGATMAALRNLLRGIAVATTGSPATVLDAVDQNLDALGITGTATVVVMTVTPAPDGTWSLTWSNAGHLPPIVLTPDGSLRMLDELHGPLLGTRMAARRTESRLVVPGGSTVVLYTDGLVETRTETIDVGLARLRMTAAATTAPRDDPAELADDLLSRNRISVEDDTAMLVCHLPVRP